MAKQFADSLNFLIEEDAKILMKTKKTVAEEKDWLKDRLKNVANKKAVCLVAEYKGLVAGLGSIKLEIERQNHIGSFALSVGRDYRRIGLGSFLTKEIIKLAKTELKPKPKIIQLGVFANNKPAIGLYEKIGFKTVAQVPKAIQYKDRLVSEFVMYLDL